MKTAINGAKVGDLSRGQGRIRTFVARLAEKRPSFDRKLETLDDFRASGRTHPHYQRGLLSLDQRPGRDYAEKIRRGVGDCFPVKNTGRLANDIIIDIEKRLRNMDWPRGYEYKFTGEKEEQEKAQNLSLQSVFWPLFLSSSWFS